MTDRWFSLGTPASSTNKTDCLKIAEILLTVELNTIVLTPNPIIIVAKIMYIPFFMKFMHLRLRYKLQIWRFRHNIWQLHIITINLLWYLNKCTNPFFMKFMHLKLQYKWLCRPSRHNIDKEYLTITHDHLSVILLLLISYKYA